MSFLGINTFQNEYMNINNDEEDKLDALTEYKISRTCRKHFRRKLTALKKDSLLRPTFL